jgi:hypothetical protein
MVPFFSKDIEGELGRTIDYGGRIHESFPC